jgi:hypothetical protein
MLISFLIMRLFGPDQGCKGPGVCRAGYKLEAALEQFACDVEGKVALDAGLSTGGFSDCLLQNGVKHIYGVDVGYGQVMLYTHVPVQINCPRIWDLCAQRICISLATLLPSCMPDS